jgi:flavodoxin
MKIGIIIYSHTGNTLHVAKSLCDTLNFKGYDCYLDEIKAENEDPNIKNPKLTTNPSVTYYDVLVFATPVRAFMISPIMQAYLKQIASLSQKPVFLFVTHHFPYAWMGGRTTIAAMSKLIKDKQGNILDSFVIDWSNKKRKQQVDQLVSRVCDKIIDIQ